MNRLVCVVVCLLGACSLASAGQRDGNPTWTSSQTAAADSIEGQLRARGICWTQSQGEIRLGDYVQDILDGRLDQPVGRGSIGQAIAVVVGDGETLITVDFGRGYCVPIYLQELCRVVITLGNVPAPEPVNIHLWYSSEPAAPDSVEGQLRSRHLRWMRTAGKIYSGRYVQDILEGRLDQPVGRGAIGQVTATGTAEDGAPLATVDFGRGYSVPIYFHELCPVDVAFCH